MPRILPILLFLAACGSSAPADDMPDATPAPFTVDHPTQLIGSRTSPNGIAVDGDTLFWYEAGGGGAIEALDLQTMARTDLAPNAGNAAQIIIADGHVYWANHDTGAIWWVPETGGTAHSIVTDPDGVYDVASDGTHLYWVSSTTAYIAQLDGTNPQTLGTWSGGTNPPG
jgi:hypothetical protein